MLNKDVGFLFFQKENFCHAIDNDLSLAALEFTDFVEISKAEIAVARYHMDLKKYCDIDEEEFSTQCDLIHYFLESDDFNYDFLREYLLIKRTSLFFPKFWFLKPALYFNKSTLNYIINDNKTLESFLANPMLAGSTLLNSMSDIDLNYDYFVMDSGLSNDILSYFVLQLNNSEGLQFTNLPVDEVQLVIKKWR